ncbi:squalene/phytoene synthase family protein [Aquabacterium fontiphilum]|uniref:squalene/phytoene synthase family protein n=1 Tax=Aquabacterium fontiphilum TaxID=450365 RepID=UPI0013771F40|nr:squalene/phytoene synthase family protein [Aquabacterium fontiphilum]NBD21020.1 squalene/phytoene synthase family protein [Aquabacterium fontiphilum]
MSASENPTHPAHPAAPVTDTAATPRDGSSLYYALRIVPARRRAALAGAAQCWLTVVRVPMTVSDPGVAETKLRWWQQEWERAANGQPQHPLTRHFANACPSAEWPMPAWRQGLIDATIQQLHQTRWLDEASLAQHLAQAGGLAGMAAARLLGADSAPAHAAAAALGTALHRAQLLARLGQDARAGWIHVPIDQLQRHEVRAHQISRPENPMPAGWPALLAELVSQTHTALRAAWQQAMALPPAERRALRPLLAMARCADALTGQIGQAGDRVLRERLMLTPLHKAWLTWLTSKGWGGLPPPGR